MIKHNCSNLSKKLFEIKWLFIFLLTMTFFSCESPYKVINENDLRNISIQKTLVKKPKYSIYKAGDSATDPYPNLLVKSNKLYLFNSDCELANDSTIYANINEFLIDENSDNRKDGIWVYSDFYTEGSFVYKTSGVKFSVDSIPRNWKGKLPKQEGIYFYENNTLKMVSKIQSEEKFYETEKDGFYYFPNNGKLFDKINIAKLD